jgi:carbon-monoxide dehydrogenase medium subunit|tara:strand:- start:8 stop:871 length:864 start_codon:yes stop_codon:yes gene_type:complete
MQAVNYARATDVDDAVRLLIEGGENARVLAGGTDLIVQARERKRNVDLLVDVKHVEEFMVLEFDTDTGLKVGAATPLYQVYGDNNVKIHYPAIVDASTVIGGKAIQGRASLGGNLGNSSPAGDSLPAMIVLGGVATLAGPNGRREVPVGEFFTGPGRNVMETGELIVYISFPPVGAGEGAAWERFIPRNEMDIAVASAGAWVKIEDGSVTDARIALGAVAATPLVANDAADALIGRPLTDESIAAAGDAASEIASPITDMRGSIKQRKHLAKVLTERTIRMAADRIR